MMKLGVTLSTYPTKFGPIVFRDGEIDNNLQVVKNLGYDGVDLFVDNISDEQIDKLRIAFEENKIEIAMYLAIFLAEKGVNLSISDREKRKAYVEDYKEQIIKGHRIGTKLMPIGFIRGARDVSEKNGDCLRRLSESLSELCDFAASKEITLCLEPINRYEINLLNNVEESLEFLSCFHLDHMGLLLDTFHMNIEDKSFEDSIRMAGCKIKHFHTPDSNRLAAGAGHINFNEIIKALKDIRYEGYLMLEAYPQPDAIICATQSVAFLRQKIAEEKF